jgi:hypothetical protein
MLGITVPVTNWAGIDKVAYTVLTDNRSTIMTPMLERHE